MSGGNPDPTARTADLSSAFKALESFKKKEDLISDWIYLFELSMRQGSFPRDTWGALALTKLQSAEKKQVLAWLKHHITLADDALSYDDVKTALIACFSAAEETDVSRIMKVDKFRPKYEEKGWMKTTLDTLEQTYTLMKDPVSTQSKIYALVQKVPADYRNRLLYQASAKPWDSWEDFTRNWMNQAPLIETEMVLKSSKQQKSSNAGQNQRKQQQQTGKKRPFQGANAGKGTTPEPQAGGNGKQHGVLGCQACGKTTHRKWDKDEKGHFVCPNMQVRETNVVAAYDAMSVVQQYSAADEPDVSGMSNLKNNKKVLSSRFWQSLDKCGATAVQLQRLVACCDATFRHSEAIVSYLCDIPYSQRTERFKMAKIAAAYACAAHPDELLRNTKRTWHAAESVILAVLPCTEKEAVTCAAFSIADKLAAAFNRLDSIEKDEVSEGEVEVPATVQSAVVTVSGEPQQLINAAETVADVAEQPAECITVVGVQQAVSGADAVLETGYLPISKVAFEQIQSSLTVRCTVDAYATAETAVCSAHVKPTDTVFPQFAEHIDPVVFWFNIPKIKQHEYMMAYKAYKKANPNVGACWLLPSKLSATMLQMLKGMTVITSFGRNAQLFHDHAKAKSVRSRCSMQVWYEPPKAPAQASLQAELCSLSIAHNDADRALVSTRPIMQVLASISRKSARVLLDSGAADHNYLSQEFCKMHNIKLLQLQTPFTAVGVQGSGQITHFCKVHVKMHTYSSWVDFKVIDLPKQASFHAILGDKWLVDTKAVLDYAHRRCVVRTMHKKHVIPAATVDGRQAAEEQPATVSIVGYNETKRIMQAPEAAYCLMLVNDKRSADVHVSSTVESSSEANPNILLEHDLSCVLNDFPDVFTEEPPHGGSQIEADVEVIPTNDDTPVLRPMFRYSPFEMEEMQKQISQLLDLGYIRPSCSPYGAPVLFVKKPRSTELRMCIDYRALNKLTRRNAFPLPRIDVLFDHLAGAKVFSLVDLRQAYHQIKIKDSDVPKTAFRTPFGHYEYVTLSFGLVNAPAAFQSVMNKIFAPMLYKYCLVYLDDILIFSKSAAEHAQHLREVLSVLRANKLTVAKQKCTFNQPEVLFLGHIVSAKGIAVDPTKVAALQKFPAPKDVGQLRSFLGTTNYFRRFVHKYAEVVRSLTDLLRKDVAFTWSTKCHDAFERIKQLLTTAPVLALPDWKNTEPFHMICDASYQGVGGILMQGGQPIAFESRKLNSAEANYSPTDLEMLAIHYCCQKWRCYIEGRDVHVYTDHKPNVTFDTVNMVSRRHARWLEALQGHRLHWHYLKGSQNIADSLSRNPVCFVGAVVPALTYACSFVALPLPVTKLTDSVSFLDQIKSGYDSDPWYAVLDNVKTLTLKDELFYKDNRLALPCVENVIQAAIRECHDVPYVGHPGRTKTLHMVQRFFWWPFGMARDVRRYVQHCDSCQRNKSSCMRPGGLLRPLPVPVDTWQSVGMDMVTDLPVTDQGNDSITVFVDRLSKMVRLAPCRKNMDAPELAGLFLAHVFRSHGVPSQFVTDRGTVFVSEFWRAFLKLLGVSSAMSSAYHPQTDGNTERVNRVMEDVLRHYVDASQTNWESLLPLVEFAINDSWHESIKAVPFSVVYGRRPPLPLDSVLRGEESVNAEFSNEKASEQAELITQAVQQAKLAMEAAQQRQKAYADAKRRDVDFVVGQEVLLSTVNIRPKFKGSPKLLPKWIGPYKIVKVINPVAFKLELPASLKLHSVFHASLLKAYKSDGVVQPPPPPEMIEGELEYVVEDILSHRWRGKKLEYLVRWLGYGHEHDTWESEENCSNSPELVSNYWARAQVQAEKKPVSKRKARRSKRATTAAALFEHDHVSSPKRRRCGPCAAI